MAVNSLNRDKLEEVKKKKAQEFKKQLKQFQEMPSSSFRNEEEKKDNVLELYKNLSETQKALFDKELERKKLRDNYSLYLKYVYPDYIFTHFHALLSNICQSVVEKVENGQKVRICISVPPQHGKLIQNDIPVITRNGWKKHGDLVVGDEVINQYGEFVKVKKVFPKDFANCKVSFTNGEEILCHENHEWIVYDRNTHKYIVRETKFIKNNFNENNLIGRGHRYRFLLPIKDFVKGEEKELFVEPYVLGAWLGDGNNTKPFICASDKDRIVIDECEKFYSLTKTYIHKTTNVIYKSYRNLRQDLQKYGMCYSKRTQKHIPFEYLTSSIRQRLELLAGLIDTDGYVYQKQNRIVFTTADIELKNTFEQLISTFGWRTTTCVFKPTKSSSGIIGKKDYWQISFNPTIFIPCRIERKQLNHFSKQRKISISNVENIEPQEGNCIEVDGGIYLVGKTMIPTHNSHTITETLPSWFIGRNQDLRCLITGYNADVAEKFGNRNRQLVKEYGKEIFNMTISESQDNKTLWDIDKHRGGMVSTGILGGLTSNTSQLTIVDDPFKNGEEANNPEIREKVFQTFIDSVATRSQGKGNAIIVIHTRWHDDDLIGRLAKLGGWIIINIPAVWEKGVDKLLHRKIGETLCPELGFDAEWAMSMQKLLGARKWNALYQGKPYIDGGNLIKRSSLKFYNENTRPMTFENMEISCDLTFGGKKSSNDNVCIGVWGRNGADHYLLKKIKKRMTFQETLQQLRVLADTFPQARKKLVEAKANGLATIETLNREIGGFVPFDPKSKSKQERFENVIPYFESGNVWLPDENVDPSIEDDIEELLRFPNGTHDDFVDMTSQYLLNYEYRYGGKVDTDNRFKLLANAIRGI